MKHGNHGASEHYQRQHKTTHVLGVDSGSQGAVTLLHLQKGYIEFSATLDGRDTPTDIIAALPLGYSMEVFLENVHAMPGQGVSTMFTFGRNFGRIETAIASIMGWQVKDRLHYVPASVWSRAVIRSKAASPKARARDTALKIWPDGPFLATEKSRQPHPGLVDSALIAEYGRRQLLGRTSL